MSAGEQPLQSGAVLLDKPERVALIRHLHGRGVFSMRGAADEVASLLGVSRAAVYNYLREGRQRRKR